MKKNLIRAIAFPIIAGVLIGCAPKRIPRTYIPDECDIFPDLEVIDYPYKCSVVRLDYKLYKNLKIASN